MKLTVTLSASLAVGCTVGSLPSEGRTCNNAACADGLWCDPVSKRCVSHPVPDAAIDRLPSDLDLGKSDALDGPVDVVDATDTGPVAHLVCDPPVLAVTTPRDGARRSPSLGAGGLTLVARETGMVAATRAAIGDPFDAWEEALLPDNHQDPTFFLHEDKPVWITAIKEGEAPRHLELCDEASCELLALNDALGLMTIDVDGPSIADDISPRVLAFNAKAEEAPGVAYLATPDNAPLTSWSATRLDQLDAYNFDVDDPAISPDGTILVFGDNNSYDLWSVRRPATNHDFSEPQRLSINDAVAEDTEPELGTLPYGKLELFFRSARGDGTVDIYRSVCTP